MDLPAIKLPEIHLPFDIPSLMHPPIDHFAIALPVIVLLIELYNLFIKRRSIGVLAFVLLTLGVAALAAAYLTGLHDGKASFEALSEAGQATLKEHKTLGTYLLLLGGGVWLFKLLSVLIRHKALKLFYLLLLLLLIGGLFEQGEEGGKLVYEHGANVQKAKLLDDKVFDLEDKIDDLQTKIKSLEGKAAASSTQTTQAAVQASSPTTTPTSEAATQQGTNENNVSTATPAPTATESNATAD